MQSNDTPGIDQAVIPIDLFTLTGRSDLYDLLSDDTPNRLEGLLRKFVWQEKMKQSTTPTGAVTSSNSSTSSSSVVVRKKHSSSSSSASSATSPSVTSLSKMGRSTSPITSEVSSNRRALSPLSSPVPLINSPLLSNKQQQQQVTSKIKVSSSQSKEHSNLQQQAKSNFFVKSPTRLTDDEKVECILAARNQVSPVSNLITSKLNSFTNSALVLNKSVKSTGTSRTANTSKFLNSNKKSLSCDSLNISGKQLIDFKTYEGPQIINYSSPFDFAKTRFINSFVLASKPLAVDKGRSTPTQTLVLAAKSKWEKPIVDASSKAKIVAKNAANQLASSNGTQNVLVAPSPVAGTKSSNSEVTHQPTPKAPLRSPVKPFLSRGSVAERVLLFEKCPPERKSKSPAILYKHWRAGSDMSSNTRASSAQALSRRSNSTRLLPGDVPRFYFPNGRPYTSLEIERQLCKVRGEFDKLPGKLVASKAEMSRITKACSLPLAWKEPLRIAVMFNRKTSGHRSQLGISCDEFLDYWRKVLCTCFDEASRFVRVLSRNQRRYLLASDFELLIQDVVDCHPGLAFLRSAAEFHSRYVQTVIARIFYSLDRSWSGKISANDLKKSNLLAILTLLDKEDDINQITDYFSYEHFYVIYCKFWELDKDHDLIIDKRDLARHCDGALSTRIIDRIMSGTVTKTKGKMTYTEFVWFLLAEEDKRHPRSIEYWFRCMDIDGDGYLSMFELEYFYEDQARRLEAMGIEALPFNDTICQMLDMVRPRELNRISLGDLKNCKSTPIFYDTFINMDKYLEHEQKDPFGRAEDDLSDWDRYAAQEYELLVAEEAKE